MSEERSYGVRVSSLGGGEKILIKQTSREVIKGGNNRHTIDHDADGKEIFRHVDRKDDQAVAQAVRDALRGRLGEQLG